MNMTSIYAGLLASALVTSVWAQNDSSDATAAAASEDTSSAAETTSSSAEDFDRQPVDCITANRIRQTKVVDDRTIVFYMGGNRAYRNQLTVDCRGLVREKRFTYDLRTNRLCDTDYITVLEYWGTTLQKGRSCGLGKFYPITREEADFLDEELEQMLENAAKVEETAESAGVVVPAESPATTTDE